MPTYRVKCLDAKYNSDEEILVLNCWFTALDSQKIVYFRRSDFYYKHPNNPVPENEMYRTADLFKNKTFNLVIEDDPNREVLDKNNEMQYAKMMAETIGDHMQEVAKGLMDEKGQIQRKLGKLVEEGVLKLDPMELIKREQETRKKLGL